MQDFSSYSLCCRNKKKQKTKQGQVFIIETFSPIVSI